MLESWGQGWSDVKIDEMWWRNDGGRRGGGKIDGGL